MEAISTLRLLLLGDNTLNKELEEQLWDLAIDGFPQTIIDCRYAPEEIEQLHDSLIKLKNSFICIRNIAASNGDFNFWLIKIAIEYIERLITETSFEDFISLCESNKGYFMGVCKECVEIIKKEITKPLKSKEIKSDLIMSFAKILKQLTINSVQTHNLKDRITALAISLRIDIKIDNKLYKSDIDKYFAYDKLNHHDKELTI